jgi:hypothetical protein
METRLRRLEFGECTDRSDQADREGAYEEVSRQVHE